MIAHLAERSPSASAERHALLAKVETTPGLGLFARAAEIVGLDALLQPGENYTIFVPNDVAFAKIETAEINRLLDPAGHERLLTLLSHHVLPERLTTDEVSGDKAYISLAGQPMTIEAYDARGTSDAPEAYDAPGAIRIGDAAMIEADLQTENGVIHVIDQVLGVADSVE